jgi:GNAT superfamily N-acetyltransferase
MASQNPDSSVLSTLPTGYYKMPPGKLANACTYLDMTAPPASSARTAAGVELQRLTGIDAARFRSLYRAVGERWLWASHLSKSPVELAAYLAAPERETFAVVDQHGDIGLLQLEYDTIFGMGGHAEIVYLGLMETEIGRGIGQWLIEQAVALAFARPVKRLWLHTCNFDHPKALAFYLRAGFRVYATGFEIMDDPRANGLLPVSAAPHVPIAG